MSPHDHTRRDLLVGAVASAATTVGASLPANAEADPVFAAIELHRAALASWNTCLDVRDRIEAEAISAGMGINGVLERLKSGDAVQALATEEAASKAEIDATKKLFDTPARTLAGLKALVDYLVGGAMGYIDDPWDQLLGWLGATLAGADATFGAPAAGRDPPPGDAELIALGDRLGAIVAEWSDFLLAEDADMLALEAAVFEATGVRFERAPKDQHHHYWRIRHEICSRAASRIPDAEHEAICHRLDSAGIPLARAMIERRPQTLTGLAAKASAVAFTLPDLWDTSPDDQPDEFMVLAGLIEDIWRVSGAPAIAALVARRERAEAKLAPQS
jgi:hypothetical protein